MLGGLTFKAGKYNVHLNHYLNFSCDLINGSRSLALSCCLEHRALVWKYWAVQAGLLTPLTFIWDCFCPLATFTSGVYFLHNGRQRQ